MKDIAQGQGLHQAETGQDQTGLDHQSSGRQGPHTLAPGEAWSHGVCSLAALLSQGAVFIMTVFSLTWSLILLHKLLWPPATACKGSGYLLHITLNYPEITGQWIWGLHSSVEAVGFPDQSIDQVILDTSAEQHALVAASLG